MFRRRPRSTRPIDSARVELGSVFDDSNENLSRTHVKVRFVGQRRHQFVPLIEFARMCNEQLRSGRPLGIDYLRVAPIVRRRHSTFFETLTDWGPVERRAYQPILGRRWKRSVGQLPD